jgi:hypothetical protein
MGICKKLVAQGGPNQITLTKASHDDPTLGLFNRYPRGLRDRRRWMDVFPKHAPGVFDSAQKSLLVGVLTRPTPLNLFKQALAYLFRGRPRDVADRGRHERRNSSPRILLGL